MKTLKYTLILIGLFNLSYSQTIKPLSAYYTDIKNTTVSDIVSPIVYYKDMANYFTPFIGNWKYTNGNKTFIVTLWKNAQDPTYFDFDINNGVAYYSDEIFGHYQLFQDYGLATQSLIYTSQINIGNTNQIWNAVILGKSVSVNKLSGTISDVNGTPQNPYYPQGVEGYLSMFINSGTNPLTASWKVDPSGELFDTNQPRTFVIPTNVTLTKF